MIRSSVILILLVSGFFCSCKKDKDTVSHSTVNGQVYNLATDSGLAGVKVYLSIKKNGSVTSTLEAMSGQNGNFSFSNVEIHSSDKYSYSLNIPSKSGIGGGEVGFNGNTIEINPNNGSSIHKINVVPKFLTLTLSFEKSSVTTASDSLLISLSQNTFHKNVPVLPYIIDNVSYGNVASYSFTYANYPMGLLHISIDKWQSGVYSQVNDSIYLDWGGTKTYTITW